MIDIIQSFISQKSYLFIKLNYLISFLLRQTNSAFFHILDDLVHKALTFII